MNAVLQTLLRPCAQRILTSTRSQIHWREYCNSSLSLQPLHAPTLRQPDSDKTAKVAPTPLQDISGNVNKTPKSSTVPCQNKVSAAQAELSVRLSDATDVAKSSELVSHNQPKELSPRRDDHTSGLGDSLQSKIPTSQVLVLWDLDNLSPGKHSTADAVDSLQNLASRYGNTVEIHAFANRHAFIQINAIRHSKRYWKETVEANPGAWEEDWQPWEIGDGYGLWEEHLGLDEPQELRCYICGQKQKTEKKLEKHIKTLHGRERRKKLKHIASQKSKKKKDKLWQKHEAYLKKFALGSARMLDPRSMGLEEDLKQAGVHVHLVADAPEAADGAIRRQLKTAIQSRIDCVFLVSNDKGFEGMLQEAKKQSIRTVVIGRKASKLAKLGGASFIAWDKVLNKLHIPIKIIKSSKD